MERKMFNIKGLIVKTIVLLCIIFVVGKASYYVDTLVRPAVSVSQLESTDSGFVMNDTVSMLNSNWFVVPLFIGVLMYWPDVKRAYRYTKQKSK